MPFATYTGPIDEVTCAPLVRKVFPRGQAVEVTIDEADILATNPEFTITAKPAPAAAAPKTED